MKMALRTRKVPGTFEKRFLRERRVAWHRESHNCTIDRYCFTQNNSIGFDINPWKLNRMNLQPIKPLSQLTKPDSSLSGRGRWKESWKISLISVVVYQICLLQMLHWPMVQLKKINVADENTLLSLQEFNVSVIKQSPRVANEFTMQ